MIRNVGVVCREITVCAVNDTLPVTVVVWRSEILKSWGSPRCHGQVYVDVNDVYGLKF